MRMKKEQDNADRVDRDAYEREEERRRREREAIAEMAGEEHREEKDSERER